MDPKVEFNAFDYLDLAMEHFESIAKMYPDMASNPNFQEGLELLKEGITRHEKEQTGQ